MEKRMFIVVSAKKAERNYQSVVFVPQCLTCEAVVLSLKNHLWKSNYRVKAYDEKPSHWVEESDYGCLGYDIFADLDTFSQHLETVKLFRKVVDKKLTVKEEVVETRKFRLSHIFTVKDVYFKEDCLYVDEGITFFFIRKTLDIKDVLFDDEDLCEKLRCKLAESGAYFLHGQWKFFRKKDTPSYWEARRIATRLEVEVIGEHLEAI